ncbi:hypothetical protein FB565_007276 [Actinoplanes lutulentus]|uniref:Amidohydrolase 3 domain-containing protein n=1 Tax=Actinoplanes lutulentus TaxID=1287878 RepID=A0A327YWQ3_9ACTN|nr:amidohydrolase [Actinoplanes lutulentus]MBB2947505.1 hypothetical protein [Actinoplanes lutulentus]RAK25661.1 hypothetical protein B0I29_13112 [Actinoplanes lutulentus]
MTYADLLFVGGPVLTVDSGRSRATALGVHKGRILEVGHRLDHLRGPRTEVVDLGGRLLLPGFQDAHVHAVFGGLEMGQCDLTGTTELADYLVRIREYAAANPDQEWIVGSGWSMESFPGGVPTAELLDQVVSDRPVYLTNRDHHGAWVNSLALKIADITRDTPDPADGVINRDSEGEPVGALQEGAIGLVGQHLPAATHAELVAGLLRAQTMLHSLGVTGWQDAMLGSNHGYPDPSDAYLSAATDGTLVSSVTGALWWERERGAEQIPGLVERRARFTTGNLTCSTVKIMQDGVAENFTAAMNEPYLDACGCATANSGLSFVEPADLARYVTALDALDFQVHFHALGDRAVREALNAVAAARAANGWTDTRPHLAHLQVMDPADVPRFRQLGATANLQMLWAAHEPQMDELTIPFLGASRAARQYVFADLLRAGATLAAGSDWPVSPANPLEAVHVAVNRAHPGSSHRPFLAEQSLDLGTALAAYTAGSAYVNHRDDSGSLVAGNVADLVVLDRDPFDGPAGEIASTTVAQTYVRGKRVYESL